MEAAFYELGILPVCEAAQAKTTETVADLGGKRGRFKMGIATTKACGKLAELLSQARYDQ